MPGLAQAAPSDPSQWPDEAGRDPELTATEDTVRFAGADRYQTNLSLNLALRGRGGFPFTTSDRTGEWWGAATCPRSILVVAGDTFADALAAASLSDPTDRSDQPRLRRVASTDPVFNPPGAFDRADTAFAPIVVTESARSGATALAASARFTAGDLASGGCTTAREAIVVGGLGAVPLGVEAELVSLGYREVFRVAGTDRYDTAAQVAAALGTGSPLDASCVDTDATDARVPLGWHGNAVVEFRPSADSCRLLPRAVVLADGDTGADALAAGWWTSYWQVPVLLTAPDGSLPPATRGALSSLPIDTLIVLGGTVRIPESTVEQARSISSSTAGRIAGADRYETSVAMAQAFGGWWGRLASERVCLAASGPGSTGWPDALAAGPFCGRMSAAQTLAPPRLRRDATTVGGSPSGHDAVPILLTPSASPELAAPVRGALAAAPAAPGFGVVFGGAAAITQAAANDLGTSLSGFLNSDTPPVARDTFATRLDLSLLFSEPGGAGPRVCQERGTVLGGRWLALYDDPERTRFLAQRDLFAGRLAPASSNVPFCMAAADTDGSPNAGPVGAGGRIGPTVSIDLGRGTELSSPIRIPGRTSGGGTRFTGSGVPQAFVDLRTPEGSTPVRAASLDLQLSFTGSTASVTGNATVRGLLRSVAGTIRGEAIRVDDAWEIRGRVHVTTAADGTQVVGGFTATIGASTGDTVPMTWQFDGFPTTAG